MKKRMTTALLALLVSLLTLTGCAASAGAGESTEGAPEDGTLPMPYALEEGRLTVESVFQYSGMNPDHGGEMGDDIAALELHNTSVLHLQRARLTMTLTDGTEIAFLVEDLPAGATARIFAADNTPMDSQAGVRAIQCQADYEEETPLLADRLTVTAEGMELSVTNTTDADLSGLRVTCHSLLDGDVWGGVTYTYSIETIPAGDTVTLQAADCCLEGAMVVRVDA